MKYTLEKFEEIFSNIWVKTIAFVPVCFFNITDKEKTALIALIVIISLDVVAGMAVARYVKNNFCWGKLVEKFLKKFILYFIGLSAGHFASKGYLEIDFLFYWLMFIITFSELGSLGSKLDKLGFKNPFVRWANYADCFVENKVRSMLGFTQNVCELKKTDDEYKLNNYKK
ncbi:MAG: hypothetical protein RBQ97_08405 [Acholeplasma sp.]|nr:hypothetical protein [Acholeplasma sp.]